MYVIRPRCPVRCFYDVFDHRHRTTATAVTWSVPTHLAVLFAMGNGFKSLINYLVTSFSVALPLLAVCMRRGPNLQAFATFGPSATRTTYQLSTWRSSLKRRTPAYLSTIVSKIGLQTEPQPCQALKCVLSNVIPPRVLCDVTATPASQDTGGCRRLPN